jgi:hypothetical protein
VTIESATGEEYKLTAAQGAYVLRRAIETGRAFVRVEYDKRQVTLPIRITGAPGTFHVYNSDRLRCSETVRGALARPGDAPSDHLDAYFKARLLVRTKGCSDDENLREVTQLWLQRACSVAQRYPNIPLDTDAVAHARDWGTAKMQRMARDAKTVCVYGKTTELI